MKPTNLTACQHHTAAQFGQIGKIEPGAQFRSRDDLRNNGLHGHGRAGIYFRQGHGAYSIVLSGGYEDDKDLGEEIWYTGEGGQGDVDLPDTRLCGVQIEDQKWERGNAALKLNAEKHLPVRVIRGHRLNNLWAPAEGFRYDGLYDVTSADFVQGKSKFMICRFTLRRQPGQPPIPITNRSAGRSQQTGSGLMRIAKARAAAHARMYSRRARST